MDLGVVISLMVHLEAGSLRGRLLGGRLWLVTILGQVGSRDVHGKVVKIFAQFDDLLFKSFSCLFSYSNLPFHALLQTCSSPFAI